jgi:hypothetical protein
MIDACEVVYASQSDIKLVFAEYGEKSLYEKPAQWSDATVFPAAGLM